MKECSDFGECSVSCGGGTMTCENTCQNGNFGDDGCPSESKIRIQSCNPDPCPGTKIIVKIYLK